MTSLKFVWNSFLLVFLSAGTLNASTVYVVHGGARQNPGPPNGGELAIVDLASGALTSLGQPVTGTSLTGLAYDGTSLWVSTSNQTLVNVALNGNPISGELTFSGADLDNADRITDLAYDPATGGLFAAGWDPTEDFTRFYSVDPATANLTLVGNYHPCSPTSCDFISIAFDTAGSLYAHTTDAPDFDVINATNGAVLSTVSGGIPAGSLGLGFNPMDGLLYGIECCDNGDPPDATTPPFDGGRIFSINPTSGASSLVTDYASDRYIHDVVFVPEPSSLSLLFTAFVALLACRRKDRL